MSTVLSNSGVSAAGNKVLWGAIGVLGVSTLALGAVILRQQMGPAQPEAPLEVVAIHSPAVPAQAESTQPPSAAVVPAANTAISDKKVPSAPAKYAQTAPKSVANQGAAKISVPVVTPVVGVPVASHTPVTAAPVPVQA
ncbi:MAG: hypothetical protein EBR49_09335, partial [Betaproteobacteria bacterium]|nr:hypothetical protein [Betaproteobacteria bacterium]